MKNTTDIKILKADTRRKASELEDQKSVVEGTGADQGACRNLKKKNNGHKDPEG